MDFHFNEVFLYLIFSGLIAGSFFIGKAWTVQKPGWTASTRLGLPLIGPSVITTLFLFYYKIRWSIFAEQNFLRLERTIAWSLGFSLYPDPETGPVMTAIYGPVSALAYWPAAWVESPFLAVQIGTAIAVFFFFAPVLWLLLKKHAGEDRELPLALLAFSCFTFLATLLSTMRESAYTVHADAPALGLGLIACLFVYFKKKEAAGWGIYSLSAIFVMLSIWSKQTMAPLIIALPFFVLLSEGWRAFWRYLAVLFIAGLFFLVLFMLLFDPHAFLYNILILPGRHPMKDGGSEVIIKAIWRLLREYLLILTAAIPAVWHAFTPEARRKTLRGWLLTYRWSLFFIVALWMTPLAMMSHMKVGGSNNTLSFVSYFLLAGTTLALIHTARSTTGPRQPVAAPVAKAAIVCYSFILLAVNIPVVFYRIASLNDQTHFAEEAYRYAKENPGTAYFPRLTLITLMTEGKRYHAADGLMDRQWAGIPVGPEQFQAHIPKDMKIIAFHGEDHKKVLPLEGYPVGYLTSKRLPSFVVYPKDTVLDTEG